MGRFVDIPGTRIWLEESDSGEAVVFLHGMACDLRVWEPVVGAVGEGFRLIRYDARGYGRSPTPEPGSAPYAHGDDLAALLDVLGIDSATVVGHSMGGGNAVDFALRHPERLRKLVLISPVVQATPLTEGVKALLGRIAEAMKANGRAAAADAWISGNREEFVLDEAADEIAVQMAADYSFWHFANDSPVTKLDPPAYDRLAEITAPVQVFTGALEGEMYQDLARRLESHCPDATWTAIPGVGHWLPCARPDVVAAAVGAP